MKTAIVAAIVAAVVGAGTASANGWINGTSIRPGTIRISRLAPGAILKLKGDAGPAGPVGPQGPQGDPATAPSYKTVTFCVQADSSVTWAGAGSCTSGIPVKILTACTVGEPIDACNGFRAP